MKTEAPYCHSVKQEKDHVSPIQGPSHSIFAAPQLGVIEVNLEKDNNDDNNPAACGSNTLLKFGMSIISTSLKIDSMSLMQHWKPCPQWCSSCESCDRIQEVD